MERCMKVVETFRSEPESVEADAIIGVRLPFACMSRTREKGR